MAEVELVMPKMGESVIEATVIGWLKKEGDKVEEDETILEVATDKVDSEIPSPVSGTLQKILVQPDQVVAVGSVIALIHTTDTESASIAISNQEIESPKLEAPPVPAEQPIESDVPAASKGQSKVSFTPPTPKNKRSSSSEQEPQKFFSPLVRNIARAEGISMEELNTLTGSGGGGRVTKSDLLNYIEQKKSTGFPSVQESSPTQETKQPSKATPKKDAGQSTMAVSENIEIQEMDRMRMLIADHMVQSKRTSAHVTSFVEADVSNLVQWRNKVKEDFQKKHREKLTYTPIFIEAVSNALNDFPMVNSSINNHQILIKRDHHIGIATALANGNLIVPVIKNVQHLSLLGITTQLNDLTYRARSNDLKFDEIQGGTFTISNIGTFGNLMGTPIINQPQVAILAVGSIKKKPVVVESTKGDTIGIRHMMFLSLSYDHRIVDGMMGGSFLKRIADNLEAFDPNRNI